MEFFGYDNATPPSSLAAPTAATLASFAPEDWEALRAYAAERRFPPGATVLAPGDPQPTLFIVQEGSVTLSGSPPAEIPAGGLFGISSFLDSQPATLTARTAAGANILLLTREALTRLAAWQPRPAILLLTELGAHLAQHLRATNRNF
jgi:CRP-like cAMP-binding protein